MNFLLEITKDDYSTAIINTKGLAETLGFGAQILFIGMLAVFAVLTILWFCMIGFKFFFHDLKSGKAQKTPALSTVPETKPYEPVASTDEEIVAVIAAAIAMAESESGGGIKFRVVSFKRR